MSNRKYSIRINNVFTKDRSWTIHFKTLRELQGDHNNTTPEHGTKNSEN